MIELQIENGRLQLHQISKKDRFDDTGATRVANFDIQNYKFSINSWKWDILTIKEWRE